MPDEKPKPTIRLLLGGGKEQKYHECEIEDQLSPDLTFTGNEYVYLQTGQWRGELKTYRMRIVTTAPYIIEHPVEGK